MNSTYTYELLLLGLEVRVQSWRGMLPESPICMHASLDLRMQGALG